MHPTYPVMLVTEFEIYVHVLLFSADWFFRFISVIFRHLETLAIHEVNTRWRITLLSPSSHVIIPLDFFLWRCLNNFFFQKFCGWHCNPSWKGVVKDILTHTWAQLVYQLYVIRATRGPLDEVGWSTHTLFEWKNSLQKFSYFYLFWL